MMEKKVSTNYHEIKKFKAGNVNKWLVNAIKEWIENSLAVKGYLNKGAIHFIYF